MRTETADPRGALAQSGLAWAKKISRERANFSGRVAHLCAQSRAMQRRRARAAGQQGDVDFVLEPIGFPPAAAHQKALVEAGIRAMSLATDDIEGDVKRLKDKGVRFTMDPTPMGNVIIAIVDDTCGNLMQLHQAKT